MDENFAQKNVELTDKNASNFSSLFYWLTKFRKGVKFAKFCIEHFLRLGLKTPLNFAFSWCFLVIAWLEF